MKPLDECCSGAELVEGAKFRLVVLPVGFPALAVEGGENDDKGRIDDEVATLPDDPELGALREAGYLRKPTKWAEGIGFPVVLSNS